MASPSEKEKRQDGTSATSVKRGVHVGILGSRHHLLRHARKPSTLLLRGIWCDGYKNRRIHHKILVLSPSF